MRSPHKPACGDRPQDGSYGIEYYRGRKSRLALKRRLKRRTEEVERSLRRHSNGCLEVMLDIGTADGLMLESLSERFGPLNFIGIDVSLELLQVRSAPGICKVQADAAMLPIKTGSADAVIATAIIEHVPDSRVFLRECARVLRLGGLLVVTTPHPFIEHVASKIGLLKDSGHVELFNLTRLSTLATEAGFSVVETRRFMLSPVPFPGERFVESLLGPLGLKYMMANQLLVARRS